MSLAFANCSAITPTIPIGFVFRQGCHIRKTDIDRYGRTMAAITCAGVSLEQTQLPCGHESEHIIVVHVKCRRRVTVEPNKIDMEKAE
jgi:hypothetical protein